MNEQRVDSLTKILTLILPLIPGAGPYAQLALQVLPAVRDIFTDAGGDGATFDALLAETRQDIATLRNPGAFFVNSNPPQPSPPTGATSPLYGVLMPGAILDDATLLAMGYKVGDRLCTAGAAWMMIRKGQPTLGAYVLRTISEG